MHWVGCCAPLASSLVTGKLADLWDRISEPCNPSCQPTPTGCRCRSKSRFVPVCNCHLRRRSRRRSYDDIADNNLDWCLCALVRNSCCSSARRFLSVAARPRLDSCDGTITAHTGIAHAQPSTHPLYWAPLALHLIPSSPLPDPLPTEISIAHLPLQRPFSILSP